MNKSLRIVLTCMQLVLIGITAFTGIVRYSEIGFQLGWFLKFLWLELIFIAFVLAVNFESFPAIKKILSEKKTAYIISAVLVGLSLTAFFFLNE
jgi:TRAP-type uncharacterized transport system fused permease subunit